MKILLKSFGLKAVNKAGAYHLPSADIYLDCRILPNPHYQPGMGSGSEKSTQDWVQQQTPADVFDGFIASIMQGMMTLAQRKQNSTKDASTLRVATFCAFGIHRSVAMKYLLAAELKARGIEVDVI